MTGDELVTELVSVGLEPFWTDKGLRVRGQLANFTPALKGLMKLHREWLDNQFRTKPKPAITLWRLSGPKHLIVLTSPPCKHIPHGADAWDEHSEDSVMGWYNWKPLASLPKSWGFEK